MNKDLLWFAPILFLTTIVEGVIILSGQFASLQNMFHLFTMITMVIGMHKLGSPK